MVNMAKKIQKTRSVCARLTTDNATDNATYSAKITNNSHQKKTAFCTKISVLYPFYELT